MIKAKEISFVYQEKEVKCSNFVEANKKLKEFSVNKNGEKIVFSVLFEDNYKYVGRLTVDPSDRHFDDLLEHHMYGKAKWLAGLATNPACGPEEYKAFLEQKEIADNIKHYVHFLNNYQIGDESVNFKTKQSLSAAISEVKNLITYNNVCIAKEQDKIKSSEARIAKLSKYNNGMNSIIDYALNHVGDSTQIKIAVNNAYKPEEPANSPYNKGVVYATKKIFNLDLAKIDDLVI